jgi:outer membrane protein OmpA-like peptidoglycan-associated protein
MARTLNPAGLHDARVALDKAEAAYSDDPGAERTADLAYLALRRAQRAEVEAQTTDWQQRQRHAKDSALQAQAKAAGQARSELATTQQELATERNARVAAESRTREVLNELVIAHAAAVKEEPRGLVVTLSGSVLFASGKATLLPGAESGLGEVARAVGAEEDKALLVEGHTDSRGSEATNLVLSKARADAVASYLITHGVPTERVTTAGIGSSRPVADNSSAEGRADNRRVELVIQTREAR